MDTSQNRCDGHGTNLGFEIPEKPPPVHCVIAVCAALQDKAYSYRDEELERHNCPVPSGVLTPPLSSEKTEELVRVDPAVLKIRHRMHAPSPQWSQSETNADKEKTTSKS